MNVKKSMPLVAAVVLGLVAMLLARSVLKPTAPVKVAGGTTPVVVATREVGPGKDLTADDLAVAQIPNGVVPSKSFMRTADLVGRAVTSPLVKGQAVLETLLAPEGSLAGLSALVPSGMRAMTMSIDEVTGLGGMIQPGCRVDVMAIVPDDKTKQQAARTVLQNIKILAVGRQLGANPGEGAPPAPSNNLTFLVTPDQARLLQLAASTSRPWLVLRSGRDGTPLVQDRTLVAELHGARLEDLLAEATTRPTTAPTAPTAVAVFEPTTRPAVRRSDNFRIVQVIRGGVVSQVTLPIPAGFASRDTVANAQEPSPVEPSPVPAADGAGKPDKSAHADTDGLKSAPEGLPSPRPGGTGTVTGADTSDVLRSDPFGGGSK